MAVQVERSQFHQKIVATAPVSYEMFFSVSWMSSTYSMIEIVEDWDCLGPAYSSPCFW